jgi:hypothetical protein
MADVVQAESRRAAGNVPLVQLVDMCYNAVVAEPPGFLPGGAEAL